MANAVAEGADAVMLSAETASGEYPLEAVQMMSKIIRQVENGPDYQTQLDVSRPKAEATVSDAISCAIRRISNVLPVAVLVNYSESGASTLRAARERPKAPILNLTPNLQTARRLSVAWVFIRWSTIACVRSMKCVRPRWKSPRRKAWPSVAIPC